MSRRPSSGRSPCGWAVAHWATSAPRRKGILCKKSTEEECRHAIAHHLKSSPHHELREDDAETMAFAEELETWTEKLWKYEEEAKDEGQGWYENRKKRCTSWRNSSNHSGHSGTKGTA